MIDANPALERYMASFEAALKRYDCKDSAEIARDLRGHIAEAQALGKPLDEVLAAVGPADALARAYAIELELNPRGAEVKRTLGNVARVVAIAAGASIVTLLVAMTLGSIGLAFTLSGVILVMVGALEAAGIHYDSVQLAGVSPWIVMALGPVFFALGVAAFWGLWAYVKALARTLARSLPART